MNQYDKSELRFLAMYIETRLYQKGITQLKMGDDLGLLRNQSTLHFLHIIFI